MTETAQERWVRRMMRGAGARPVGHAEPDDVVEEEGPQIPVPPTPPVSAPTVPVQKARVPDWWRTARPLGDSDDDHAEQAADEHDQDDELVELVELDDEHDQDDGTEPVPASPVVTDRVSKTRRPGKARPRRKLPHAGAEAIRTDPRMRWVAFTGSAAYAGHAFGLDGIFRAYLPFAEQAAVGTFGLVLAAAAGWGAWKATGFKAVESVFQNLTPFLRLGALLGAAEFGRRLGPVPVAYLNRYGQEWGLGPSAISLLVTDVGICGLLWWFIDRPLRRKGVHWSVRWMFRVPLASALLACLPYSTGPMF